MKSCKIISALLALAVSVGAVGCGSSGDEASFGHKPDSGSAASSDRTGESSSADSTRVSGITSAAESSGDSADGSSKEGGSSGTDSKKDGSDSSSSKADVTTAKKPAVTTAKQTETEKPVTTVVPETTATTTKQQTEPPAEKAEEYIWNWGGVSLTIPKSLYGKYVIQDGTLYCKKCYDNDSGSGAVFYLMTRSDLSDFNMPVGYLLGMDYSGNYYIGYTATGATYDVYDRELNDAYNEIVDSIDQIVMSARGEATPYSEPFAICQYAQTAEPSLRGLWQVSGMEGAMIAPSVIFDGDRRRFQYYGYYGVDDNVYGTILYNKNVQEYQWNTSNWGDFGLVFLNGSVYKVNCDYTAPQCVSFKCVMGYDNIGLEGKYFYFYKDYESLYEYW